jgi:hypothetical protein
MAIPNVRTGMQTEEPDKNKPLTLGRKTQFLSFFPIAQMERISFLGTSFLHVRDSLIKIFGTLPLLLEKDKHLAILRGIEVATAEGSPPWKEIADAVEKYNKIEIRIED